MTWKAALGLILVAIYAPFIAMTAYLWAFDHQNFATALRWLPVAPGLMPVLVAGTQLLFLRASELMEWLSAGLLIVIVLSGLACLPWRSRVAVLTVCSSLFVLNLCSAWLLLKGIQA